MTTIHNNTDLTLAEIQLMKIVGKIKNNWRRRHIILYADQPTLQAIADMAPLGYLYMVGTTFDGSTIVISKEELGRDEKVAMDYWSHGQKELVRD